MGLFTMRERATLANGTFEIVSTPHHGTSVRVRIPVVPTATATPRNSAAIFQTEIH
jgi:signal transduction histidine kinase